jgi:hypothetical protein
MFIKPRYLFNTNQTSENQRSSAQIPASSSGTTTITTTTTNINNQTSDQQLNSQRKESSAIPMPLNDESFFSQNQLLIGTKDMLLYTLSQQIQKWKKRERTIVSNGKDEILQNKKILYICNSELNAFCCLRHLQRRIQSANQITQTESFPVVNCTMIDSPNAPTLHQMYTSDCLFTTTSNVLQWMKKDKALFGNYGFNIYDFDIIILDEVCELKEANKEHSSLYTLLTNIMTQYFNKQYTPVIIGMSSDILSGNINDITALCHSIRFIQQSLDIQDRFVHFIDRYIYSNDITVKRKDQKFTLHDHIGVPLNEEQQLIMRQLMDLILRLKDYILTTFSMKTLETLIPSSFQVGTFEFEEWLLDLQQFVVSKQAYSLLYCLQVLYDYHLAYGMIQEEPNRCREQILKFLSEKHEQRSKTRLPQFANFQPSEELLWERVVRVKQQLRQGILNSPNSSLGFMSKVNESNIVQDINALFNAWLSSINVTSEADSSLAYTGKCYRLISFIQEYFIPRYRSSLISCSMVIVSNEHILTQLQEILANKFSAQLHVYDMKETEKNLSSGQTQTEKDTKPYLFLCTRSHFNRLCLRYRWSDLMKIYDLIVEYDAPSRSYYVPYFAFNAIDSTNAQHVYIYNMKNEIEDQLESINTLLSMLVQEYRSSSSLQNPRKRVRELNIAYDNRSKRRLWFETNSTPPSAAPATFQASTGHHSMLQAAHNSHFNSAPASLHQDYSHHHPYHPSNTALASIANSEDISFKMNMFITKRFKTSPNYEVKELADQSTPSNHLFEAVLSLNVPEGTYISRGIGKNKKEAKRAAASEMYWKLSSDGFTIE